MSWYQKLVQWAYNGSKWRFALILLPALLLFTVLWVASRSRPPVPSDLLDQWTTQDKQHLEKQDEIKQDLKKEIQHIEERKEQAEDALERQSKELTPTQLREELLKGARGGKGTWCFAIALFFALQGCASVMPQTRSACSFSQEEKITLTREDWLTIRRGQERDRFDIEKLKREKEACEKSKKEALLVEIEKRKGCVKEIKPCSCVVPWVLVGIAVAAGAAGIIALGVHKNVNGQANQWVSRQAR